MSTEGRVAKQQPRGKKAGRQVRSTRNTWPLEATRLARGLPESGLGEWNPRVQASILVVFPSRRAELYHARKYLLKISRVRCQANFAAASS